VTYVDPTQPEPTDNDGSLSAEKPGGFEQIPHALWFRGGDTPNPSAVSDGAVLAYLALSKRSFGKTVPRRSTLARDMNVSVRTVDTRLRQLVEKGWLLITPRFRAGGDVTDCGQTTNHYALLFEPITSAADPRLVQHHQRVAAFHSEMERRRVLNERRKAEMEAGIRLVDGNESGPVTPSQDSARGGSKILLGGAQDSARGPSQDVAGGPSQDSAPQEKDLLRTRPLVEEATGADAPASDLLPFEDDTVETNVTTPVVQAKTDPTVVRSAGTKGTRIPGDFKVTDAMHAWAQEKGFGGLPLEQITEEFFDYWVAQPGARGVKLDWTATWRLWIRRDQQFTGRERGRTTEPRGEGIWGQARRKQA